MLRLGSSTFFTFGIVLTLLGATQAEMARELGLDLAASGFLGAVLALGMGAGVLIAGPIVDRFSRAPLFAGACLVAAGGMFVIGPHLSYRAIVGVLLITGLGCGFYNTIVNTVVLERAGERGASALAIVHSSATLGAAVGPLVVRAVLGVGHWSFVFHGIGALHCLLAFGGLGLRASARVANPNTRTNTRTKTRAKPNPNTRTKANTRTNSRWRARVVAAPALAALGLVTFAYVGVENGLTLFTVPWAVTLGESERVGQWSISTFWGGLLIGRLSLVVRRAERGLQLLAACGIAGAAIVCISSALSLGPLFLVTVVAGVALGPVYPTTIALAAERVPSASGTALGLVAATGACGGFAIPWLIGAVGDAIGVRPAITLLGAFALVIAGSAFVLARRDAYAAASSS
ncbi:MAG TPA: MFS transporter [Polyangiales bacterium]|nr:MFS transporter [Polyangiales bacterium]